MRIGIIGAGMSGLSLAVHLLQNQNIEKIVLIEQREHYIRDKTWCYFRLHSHRFEQAVSHRWEKFSIRTSASEKTIASPFAYEMIQSDHFYDHALSALKSDSRANLRLNSSVSNIQQDQYSAQWQYQEHAESFDYIFDSKPNFESENHWQQMFSGGVIKTTQAVFDETTAQLMDFSHDKEKVKFHYLLPLDCRHALIQETWFVPPSLRIATPSVEPLESYLQKRFSIQEMEWDYLESGAIPMQVWNKKQHDGRILPIGAAAGWIRGATGYSFLETQRACQRIAEQLASSLTPDVSPHRPHITETLDGIFLQALASDFENAPTIFQALFDNTPAEAVLRFLGGTGTVADHMHVIAACPKLRFLAAAAKHVWA